MTPISISKLCIDHRTCSLSIATFSLFGLFATGILSISDRNDYCTAAEFIFDITDVGGGHFDSDVALSAKPACRPFRFLGNSDILTDNEGIC